MRKFAFVMGACAAVALGFAAGAGQAMAAGGTVSGQVKLAGTAPAPKQIDITKDKDVCGLKPHFDQSLVVNGGAIQYAVVVVEAKGPLKAEEVKFDQHGCQYQPHVLAFPAGSTVDIINSDGILHNIHTYSKVNPSFNMAQPKFKKVVKKVIDKPEVIKVTCDAHNWMKGYWYASDSPYFAVTDEKGNYTIKDVPPGTYDVKVWQESLGTEAQHADVKDGATTTLNFEMKPKG
jgi:plastocyanin